MRTDVLAKEFWIGGQRSYRSYLFFLETKLAWWQERNAASTHFQQLVARCLGRAPLRFYAWPHWPLPYAATALHSHFSPFSWHT
jgi:hypothetical protein